MGFEYHYLDLRALNFRTLKMLESGGLLKAAAERAYSSVVNDWLFPLHGLDLQQIPVNRSQLREAQENAYYAEMGIGFDYY